MLDEKPIKVLCIEDERFISELYMRALTRAGYTVTIVEDGADGLYEASKDEYDLVLLDLMLPTLNGIDTLYKLRDPSRENPLKAKIVITTNLDQEEAIRKQVEQMADGYLIKAEITPKELVDYVSQFFQKT